MTPNWDEKIEAFITRYMQDMHNKELYPEARERLVAACAQWKDYRKIEATNSVYTYEMAVRDFDDWHGSVENIEEILGNLEITVDLEQTREDNDYKVIKTRDEEQLVFGWANIAVTAEGFLPFDWQGDIKSSDTLEKAAYNFVLKYRESGEMHNGQEAIGQLVESVMFTKEKMAAMGIPEGLVPQGWWVGFYIPDTEVFSKIKSGVYKMFSIEGTAKRVPVE